MNNLIIRADANNKIGTGHLMRCLALAQAWIDTGGSVRLITVSDNSELMKRVKAEGVIVHHILHQHPHLDDWTNTKSVLDLYPNSWVVLDGYNFDDRYQQSIKERNHRLLVIDDQAHLEHYYCDLLLNQNFNADKLNYSTALFTRRLLGPKYALLRRDFIDYPNRKENGMTTPSRLLVTLGGSDPENYTKKLIEALYLLNMPGLETKVLIGASNSFHQQLESVMRDKGIPITLIPNTDNMPKLMEWADVAISAAGTTVWELAFMGVPTILLVIAENQRRTAEQLHSIKAAINLGSAKDITVPQLVNDLRQILGDTNRLRTAGQQMKLLVDGQGPERIVMHLKNQRIRLRRSDERDCELLWHWANDSIVRQMSFSPNPISWEDHVRWFSGKLTDAKCIHYIALDENDIPIGQVRFDVCDDGEAEISISLDKEKRTQGYGRLLVDIGSQRLLSNTSIRLIHAFIKSQNEPSIRAFRAAKYEHVGNVTTRGNNAVHLLRKRKE